MVGVPGGSSGIDIARRLGLPAQVIDRARAQLSPEAHEAAALIAYLHRSRDELETLKREAARAAQEFAEEKKRLQTEWTDRQRTRLKELEHQFAQTIEKHEKEVARAIEAVKERELRAQLEKQTHRKLVKARGDAREEADAATVAHLADSQADLGIAAAQSAKPVAQSDLVPGARVRVRGLPTPVTLRRRDGDTAEVEAGPLRMKVALADITAIVGEEASSEARPAARRHRPHAARDRARRRRNQPDRLHGRGSHAPRGQIPRSGRTRRLLASAHHPRPRHRRAAPRPRRIPENASAGRDIPL